MESPKPAKHGVVAVLEDAHGRFLLIRRGLQLARAPGFWCFVGGEVEAGESYEKAIVREVSEEVGLCVRPLEKIHETISPNGEFLLHWIRVERTDGCQEMILHAHEVAEACWANPLEALELTPMLPGLKLWLQERT
jgi:8-oxo-dGTP pyrophosphatase MutT (NUDIX family)